MELRGLVSSPLARGITFRGVVLRAMGTGNEDRRMKISESDG